MKVNLKNNILFEVEAQHHGEPATRLFLAPNWVLAKAIKKEKAGTAESPHLPTECAAPWGGSGRGQKAPAQDLLPVCVAACQGIGVSQRSIVASSTACSSQTGRRIQSFRAFRRPLFYSQFGYIHRLFLLITYCYC